MTYEITIIFINDHDFYNMYSMAINISYCCCYFSVISLSHYMRMSTHSSIPLRSSHTDIRGIMMP